MWQQFMRVPNSSVLHSFETSAVTAIKSQEDPTILPKKVLLLEPNEEIIQSDINKTSRNFEI
jgi:hypothetical protein